MNDRGNAHAGQKSGDLTVSQLPQKRPELASGPALQGLSHNAHAEQEQAQSADKSQHIENIHKADFLSLLVSRFYSNKCV